MDLDHGQLTSVSWKMGLEVVSAPVHSLSFVGAREISEIRDIPGVLRILNFMQG